MPPRNRLLRRVKRHARFGRLARQPVTDASYRPVSPPLSDAAPVVRARLLTQRGQRDYVPNVPVQEAVPVPERRASVPPAAVQREPQPPQSYPTPPAAAPREPDAFPLRQPASPAAPGPAERQTPAIPSAPQAPPLQRAPQPPPAAPPPVTAAPQPAASQPPPSQPPDEDAPSEEEQASWNRLQSIMRAHKTMEAEGREPEVKRNIEAPWLREAAQKADRQAARRPRKTSRPTAQEPPRVQRTGRRSEVTYVKPGEESLPTRVSAPPPLRPRPVVDAPGETAAGEAPPVQRAPSPEPTQPAPDRSPADPASERDVAVPPVGDAPAGAETPPPVQRSESPSETVAPPPPEQQRAPETPPTVQRRPAETPSTLEPPAGQRRPADSPAAPKPAGQEPPSAAARAAAPPTPEPESVVEPPVPAEGETIVRRTEQPSAPSAEPAGGADSDAGPSLDKVWPVQQQAPDDSSRLELVDDPAEIVPDRPPRPFRQRDTEEDAPVRDVLRKVDSGQQSKAQIETLMPRLPRPQNAPPPRAKTPTESKPRVQRSEPPEIEMIETEIGELPSDLWTLLGQPVPGKETPAGEAPSAPSGRPEKASSAGRQVARVEKSEPAPQSQPAPDRPESRPPPPSEVQSAAGPAEPAPPAAREAPPAQQVARTPEEERDDGPKVKGVPPRTPPAAERAPTSGPRDWAAELPPNVQAPLVDVPPTSPRVRRAEEATTASPQERSQRVSDAPVPSVVSRAVDAPDSGPVVDVLPRTEGRLAPEFTPSPPVQRQVVQREAVPGPAEAVLSPPERVADAVAASPPEPAVQRVPERRAESAEQPSVASEPPATESRRATDEALQRAIARAEAPPEGARTRREEKQRTVEDGAVETPARVDRPVIQRTIEIPEIETAVPQDRTASGDESGADEAEIDVDKLAREVYREIKRRLDVERERGRGLFG